MDNDLASKDTCRHPLMPMDSHGHPWTLSGHVQDWECTRCLGACGALMDLQRVTQGECVLAE